MATQRGRASWRAAAEDEQPLWYLGYGSNMKSSSMIDRKIEPLASKRVRVPSHYVVFDVFGIPYSEPCYASIRAFSPDESGPSSGPELHLVHDPSQLQLSVPPLCGVAHLLTPSDFGRLLVTEGSGVVYDIIQVQAVELDDEEGVPFAVYALEARWPQRPNATPSARYLDLFVRGARDYDLPQDYVDYLERLPRYHKAQGAARTMGHYVFDYGWRPLLKRLVRLTTWRVDEDGNCPGWVAVTIVWLYRVMWKYHDVVHVRVWGRGDGGKMRWITKEE